MDELKCTHMDEQGKICASSILFTATKHIYDCNKTRAWQTADSIFMVKCVQLRQ